jgi:hypothetical protein
MIAEINGRFSVPADGRAIPVSHASSIPFRIVSLLDMIEFEAREFFGIINRLISVRKDLEKPDRPPLTPEEQVHMHTHMDRADFMCARYHIDVSYYTERVRGKIDEPERYTYSLASAVDAVRHCIMKELKGRKFMYMPDAEAKYYDQNELFGEDVHDSFSEAAWDITAVGNCIACGLYTASVFHSMRVAEFGLRRIAAKLQVKLKDKKGYYRVEYGTWDKIITACKTKIEAIRKTPIGPKRREQLEFYSDAGDHCLFMKDIWRNNISHTQQPYNEPEALAVLERVKGFMGFLAANVS